MRAPAWPWVAPCGRLHLNIRAHRKRARDLGHTAMPEETGSAWLRGWRWWSPNATIVLNAPTVAC